MLVAAENPAVLDEEIWRAWLQKSKLREQATARKAKLAAAVVLPLLVLAGVAYRFL
jgi:hypothetical protein